MLVADHAPLVVFQAEIDFELTRNALVNRDAAAPLALANVPEFRRGSGRAARAVDRNIQAADGDRLDGGLSEPMANMGLDLRGAGGNNGGASIEIVVFRGRGRFVDDILDTFSIGYHQRVDECR